LGIELIHVDGKTAKGSYDREEKLKPLHWVSAWTIDVILAISDGEIRFGALKRCLRSISSKVLTVQLRMLEEIGAVNRSSKSTVRLQVIYELSSHRHLQDLVSGLGAME
jgi:DNA-binding HxlR family transcriptional regulator